MDIARLKSIPLFSSFSDEELATIAPFAAEVEVPEGKRLVNEGDYSYEFLAIEEGEVEVFRGGEKINELGPGDFFGETGLIEKDRRNATVVAKTPMKLITLTGWDMKRVARAMPDAIDKLKEVIEQRRPA